jgi:3-isopropylmalate/(R)-2-methylmalate dehydratase large subunit
MTLAQKILARAAGLQRAEIGQIITCKVDLAMMHDSGGPRRVAPKLKQLGRGIWDASKVVVVSDHYVPAIDADSAHILQLTRGFVAEHGIEKFYDMRGICHVVLAEGKHLQPGMFAVGGDSHSPTGGAWGALMVGIGATEMAGVLATGSIWMRVPETLRIRLRGELHTGVAVKDVMLHLLATLGMNNDYQVIEFQNDDGADTLAKLSIQDRMTLCNMTAELGAKTGLFAPDAITYRALDRSTPNLELPSELQSDPGARYSRTVELDLNKLSPFVAEPHRPDNAFPINSKREYYRSIKLDQCYIGACTGAKLEDLQMAARVLTKRKLAKQTRLLIAPASSDTVQKATADGTLSVLLEAGAILLSSGCGACAGLGAGLLGENEICLASTARNFKGRMGAASAQVYLASPYVVAASAVTGVITDPREFLPS